MLRDNSNESIRFALNSLSNGVVETVINQSYLIYGMFENNMDPNLAEVLKMPENATMSVWVMMVKHDFTIQINSRLAG